MRVIFLGTPEFAQPTLEKLIAWPKCQVVGVVCQPDRPSGRGYKIDQPPIKIIARAHNIAVLQPEKLSKSPETVAAMRDLKPDILVMVAFGQILKEPVLKMAPYGVVNVHASLLPKYRGPAPINWAIINGEYETGVTTMLSDAGVDTGAMLLKKAVTIEANTNAEQLAKTLSYLGAELLIETLEQIVNGTIKPKPQDNSQASLAPLLKKEMGQINWSKSAKEIHNQIRGLYPWPGTYTQFSGTPLKILSSHLLENKIESNSQAGQIIAVKQRLLVACGDKNCLELVEVQAPNKSRVKACDWANGQRVTSGAILGI